MGPDNGGGSEAVQSPAEERGAAGRRTVLVVAGPTASGKSALALSLAERCGGIVVNADAMQLYDSFRILTARPDPVEEARAPHLLYGVLPAEAAASAAAWREMALAAIGSAGGRLPILVGGTGLYLRALMQGLSEMPEVPAAIRDAGIRRRELVGAEAFHAEVAARDPETAARLPVGDRQRLIRAWEVFEATGRPLSAWQRGPTASPPDLDFLPIVLDPPRAWLYDRIDRRLEAMLAAGVLREVEAARDLSPSLPVAKALGFAPFAAHLGGALSLDQALAAAQQDSRRYAKRQVTWFRHQLPGAHRVATQYSVRLADEIFAFIRQTGLTRLG